MCLCTLSIGFTKSGRESYGRMHTRHSLISERFLTMSINGDKTGEPDCHLTSAMIQKTIYGQLIYLKQLQIPRMQHTYRQWIPPNLAQPAYKMYNTYLIIKWFYRPLLQWKSLLYSLVLSLRTQQYCLQGLPSTVVNDSLVLYSRTH